jgi:hypothetical protein
MILYGMKILIFRYLKNNYQRIGMAHYRSQKTHLDF